jgi:DNA-binding CsgD family transcriptional regulator
MARVKRTILSVRFGTDSAEVTYRDDDATNPASYYVHGLNLARSKYHTEIEDLEDSVSRLLTVLLGHATVAETPREVGVRPVLTDIEVRVLAECAKGNTQEQGARALYMSVSAFKGHLTALNHKFSTHNRVGVVMAGVRWGYVQSQ